ncbi:hypothetical protein OG426_01335 [Streptomyces canus]|nr:hypothetical protein OG426_01335 [Streptomyces canus]
MVSDDTAAVQRSLGHGRGDEVMTASAEVLGVGVSLAVVDGRLA